MANSAFSVTVLGLLVGAIAFALSLARDRIYGQDYSDLEYVAAVLTASAFRGLLTTPLDEVMAAALIDRIRHH